MSDEFRVCTNNPYEEIERLRAELAAERELTKELGNINYANSTEIYELKEQVRKLREALVPFIKAKSAIIGVGLPGHDVNHMRLDIDARDLRRARAVLAETKGDGDE
jgi:hypothetical protein